MRNKSCDAEQNKMLTGKRILDSWRKMLTHEEKCYRLEAFYVIIWTDFVYDWNLRKLSDIEIWIDGKWNIRENCVKRYMSIATFRGFPAELGNILRTFYTLPGVYIWLILTFIDWFLGKIGFAKHLKLPPSANRLVTGSDRIYDALEPSQRVYFIQYQDVSHASSTMESFRAKCFCNPGTNLMLLSRANSRNSFCHYIWRNLTQYKFGIRDRRATRSRVSEIHKLLIIVV